MESENKVNAELAALQETAPIEIAPGMTIEEMNAMFFDANALREPPYKLYQLNGNGHRYYYRYDEQGEPIFYPSVTTLLKQTMPTSPFLIEWMIKNGADGATEKRDLAASYGSFMHWQFEILLINRTFDFDTVGENLLAYMEANNLPEKFFADSITKIRKDVCAFAQFVKDWNVKPLAIEIALAHPVYNYAGMVDLPCMLTDPKTGETFPAIVDFKSGRKGFWEEHEIQLHLYKMMWNENFPKLPITRVFNFSPKDWRGVKPTYNFKEQTDSPNASKIPALLELAAIEDGKKDNTFTIISGKLDLDNFKPSNNIVSLSLAELVKNNAAQDENPDVAGFVPKIAEIEPKIAENVPNIAGSVPDVAESEPTIAEPVQAKPKRGRPKKESKINQIPDWLAMDSEKAQETPVQAKEQVEPINTTSTEKKANTNDFAVNLLDAEIEL